MFQNLYSTKHDLTLETSIKWKYLPPLLQLLCFSIIAHTHCLLSTFPVFVLHSNVQLFFLSRQNASDMDFNFTSLRFPKLSLACAGGGGPSPRWRSFLVGQRQFKGFCDFIFDLQGFLKDLDSWIFDLLWYGNIYRSKTFDLQRFFKGSNKFV